MIGTQVGKYQITERVGGGGFATVYKGNDLESGQVVAIKILREEYAEDEQFIERFRKEAKLIQSLPSSPHIVGMMDYGQVGNTYYLVMEFVEGDDLDQVLMRRGTMQVDQAVNIASQVASALSVAHQRRIVHRDIKPQNIKLRPDGTVKVLDFGIARATDGTRLTQTGAFIGTPLYMAPEIWEGQPAGPPADIYSLGVVLYELIAGRPPFQADTPAAIMRQQLMEEPRPLNAVRVDTPPRLVWIVSRCLAKTPSQRYASADDLLVALQGKAEAAPPRASPVQPRPRRRAPSIPLSIRVKRQFAQVSKRANSVLTRLPELARGQPRAYLQGRAGRMAGYRFRLSARDTVLGQAPNCAIQLSDRYLSQHHARIFFTNSRFYLYDLNSHNGTYLNGYRLQQPHALQHGDQVQIGESVFNFMVQAKQPSGGVYRGSRSKVADQLLAAAAAHASVLLIPLLVPALIWASYKDRSPYVSYQAKQALLYQGVYVSVLFLRFISPLGFLPFGLLWLLASAGGCYAAYRCYKGQQFVYPFLGDLVTRF